MSQLPGVDLDPGEEGQRAVPHTHRPLVAGGTAAALKHIPGTHRVPGSSFTVAQNLCTYTC